MRLLLLEDRVVRQQNFIKELGDDLFKKYNAVLDNKTGNEFEAIKRAFSIKDFSCLESYDGIIVHRSAFNKDVKVSIFEHCKVLHKPLVYFSGGISSISLDESMGFPFLTINSKDFYSNSLVAFLSNLTENSEINLGSLAFGSDWELNLLLSLRQRISFDGILETTANRCDVSEIQSKYQIQNGYIMSLLERNLSWFREGEIIDNPVDRISEIKSVVQSEINNKIIF